MRYETPSHSHRSCTTNSNYTRDREDAMTLSKALFTSKKDYWETPQDFFDELNSEFCFTLDPASTK